MNLIARCPECSTLFRVTEGQLRAAGGWVRCGRCAHVFDGNVNIHPLNALAEDGSDDDEPIAVLDADATDVEQPVAAPAMQIAQIPALPPLLLYERHRTKHGTESELTSPQFKGIGQANGLDEPHPTQPGEPLAENDFSDEELGFIRQAKVKSVWHAPWMRWTSGVLAGVLLLMFAGQVLIYQRNRLMGAQPELAPMFKIVCRFVGCRLEPPQNIEAFVIENSALSHERGYYQLRISLRNTGAWTAALPGLELTLTDSQDTALLRKVFLPKDFAGMTNELAQGGHWAGTLNLSVEPVSLAERVNGYRLRAFYP